MKYNKNADTLLFLLLFSTSQSKKNIEKTFVNAGTQKRWKKTGGIWEYFTTISTETLQ